MKTMKSSIIVKAIIITAVFLIVPMMVTAMGNSESAGGANFDEDFLIIAQELEAGDLTMEEALEQMYALRTEYGLEENENTQAMKGLLEAVQTREMTMERVREQLRSFEEDPDASSENKVREQVRTETQTRTPENTETPDNPGDAASEVNKPEPTGQGNSN
jgi:hypothetical protein